MSSVPKSLHYSLILALTAALYVNALPGAWHYDDFHSVADNLALRSLANVPRFFTDPTTFSANPEMAMYRPVLLVSYAVQYAITGPGVGWWHLGNVMLHGANACLVGWIGASLIGPAGVAAGYLFAAHPLATEPVNYVSGRSDLLMALWWLVALGLAVRYPIKRGWLIWAFVGLALLTKESAVTLPAVLLLAWAVPHRGLLASPWWRGKAVAAVALLCVWVNLSKWVGTIGDSLDHPVRSWLSQAITQVMLLPTYLGLLVWPVGLTVEHEAVALSSPVWQTWVTLAGLLVVAALVPWMWRRSRLAVFLLAWGVLALLPVLVMPLNVLLNERRLYLPLAAACVGAVVFLGWAWQGHRRTAVATVIAGVTVLGGLTLARNPVWASELALWEDAVVKGPTMPRSWIWYGNSLADLARQYRAGGNREAELRTWRRAAACFQCVREIATTKTLYCRATNNLGSVWLDLGRVDRAEPLFREALALDSTYADAWVNLAHCSSARAMRESGPRLTEQWGVVHDQYIRALKLSAHHLEANVGLSKMWYAVGDTSWGRYYLARAREVRPDDVRWQR